MTDSPPPAEPGRRQRPPRRRATRLDKVRWLMAYSVDLLMLLSLVGLFQLVVLADAGLPMVVAVIGMVLSVVLFVLATRPFRLMMDGRPRPTALLAVAGVIALVLTVAVNLAALPVWLAMMAPFVRRRTVFVLAGLILALTTGGMLLLEPGAAAEVALAMALLLALAPGAVMINQALWHIAAEAHEGEEAKAQLAVSEERLRLARDLNDLLGQSLQQISAQSLAAAGKPDHDLAKQEMFEVRDLARGSLKRVREAVQNYRVLDLDETLASVRAVLEAADVECTVRARTADLSARGRTILATAVREGATTILQQGTAKRCVITIEGGVLEMSNDGDWQGLEALAARVSAAGGSVSSEPGLFRATVPA